MSSLLKKKIISFNKTHASDTFKILKHSLLIKLFKYIKHTLPIKCQPMILITTLE